MSYNDYYQKFMQISQKYDLNLQPEEYRPILDAIERRNQKKKGGFFRKILGGRGLLGTIFKIAFAALGVVVTVATGGAFATVATVIAGAVIGTATSLYNNYLAVKSAFLSSVASDKASALSATKNAQEAHKQKDQLTHLIIYEPFSILPNGSLYKAQAPGSESFSPTIAYDSFKGILEDFKKAPTDEIIQNRNHIQQAGNNEYLENILNVNIPLAKFELPIKAINDSLEDKARLINRNLADGFKELCENHYNILETAQAQYDRRVSTRVKPLYRQIATNDFLEKNQNYSKGLRADFNFTFFNKIYKSSQSPEDSALRGEITHTKNWDQRYRFFRDKQAQGSTYEKAQAYYDACLYVVNWIDTKLKDKTITLRQNYFLPTLLGIYQGASVGLNYLRELKASRTYEQATNCITRINKEIEAKIPLSHKIDRNRRPVIAEKVVTIGGQVSTMLRYSLFNPEVAKEYGAFPTKNAKFSDFLGNITAENPVLFYERYCKNRGTKIIGQRLTKQSVLIEMRNSNDDLYYFGEFAGLITAK